MLKSTTVALKPADVEKKWIVIDAEGVVVGRLATFIANRLRGKHLPTYTPHVDLGDNVIVINADKVVFTGKKLTDKIYYRHTGHPGGIKQTTPEKVLNGRFPERVLEKAVERMMPKESPLARLQMTHLRIFSGPTHTHEAQQPEVIDFAGRSAKNTRSI
jgi:large subunit ribosomal protein L13